MWTMKTNYSAEKGGLESDHAVFANTMPNTLRNTWGVSGATYTHKHRHLCHPGQVSLPVPLDPLNDGRRDVYVTQRRSTHVTLKTLLCTSCTRCCTHSLTNSNKKHELHPETVANSFKVQPSVSRSKFRERERIVVGECSFSIIFYLLS